MKLLVVQMTQLQIMTHQLPKKMVHVNIILLVEIVCCHLSLQIIQELI